MHHSLRLLQSFFLSWTLLGKCFNAVFPSVADTNSRTPRAHGVLCVFSVLGCLACPSPLDSDKESRWKLLGCLFYLLEHMLLDKASNILATA